MALDFTESYPIIQWDLNNQTLFKYYKGSVDDSGNGFKLQIIQGNSLLTPTTEQSFFYFEKSDGTKGYIDSIISGTYFVFNLTNQVYAVAREVSCNFQISNGTDWRTSPEFIITVDNNNIQDSIESSNDFIAFQNALNSLGDITEEVNQAVIDANTAISTINTTNTNVQNAENIRVTNENQRIANENIRISNEDARIAAEDLRPDYYYVTQSQYDALPQEDKDNPKNIYEITDNDGVLPNELQNLITEAQEATEAAWQAAGGSLPDFGTAGTYNKVTTDAKGRVQSGTLENTIAGLGVTNVYTKTEVDSMVGSASWEDITDTPTTRDGYGITDVYTETEIDNLLDDKVSKNNLVINAKDFGVIADGTTDDSTALQNAINYAGTNGCKIVKMPKGSIGTASTIILNYNNIKLIGEGRGATKLIGIGATSPVLQIGDSTHNVTCFSLENFSVGRNLGGATKTGTIGFHYVKSFHPDICNITNMSFYGSQYNVKTGDGTNRPEAFTVWENCEFGNYDSPDDYSFYCLDGIEQKFKGCRFQGFNVTGFYNPNDGNPNDWVFEECYFGSVAYSFGGTAADYCVRLSSGFAFMFTDSIFEQGKAANVLIEKGKIYKFNGCMCGGAGYTGYGYHIQGTAGSITNVSINGGEIRDFGQSNSNFSGNGRGVYIFGSTNGVSNVAINGVNIRVDNGSGIRNDAKQVTVTGNTIDVTADCTAVLVTANADTGTINGNTINCPSNSTVSPINLATGCGGICVTGNSIVKGSASSGIANTGDASNVVANNSIV